MATQNSSNSNPPSSDWKQKDMPPCASNKKNRCGLEGLPEEILIYLTTFLNGQDVVRLTHVSHHLLHVLQSDDFLWLQILERENLQREPHVVRYAHKLSDRYNCQEKLSYVLHKRLQNNWKTGKCKISDLNVDSVSKIGHDSNHLVILDETTHTGSVDNWTVTVWDISACGLLQVVCKPWSANLLAETQLKLTLNKCTILVAKGTAVMCFNGKGDYPPQEMVACDIQNDFTELWRNVEVLGCRLYHLFGLFGTDVYKLVNDTYTIEVFDIRNHNKMYSIPPVKDMHPGYQAMSGDGKHLAVSGSMFGDNSPLIGVWNLRLGTQRVLVPQVLPPNCDPLPTFQKVVVCHAKVYGLLNATNVFIWNAETGQVENQIALMDEAGTFISLNVTPRRFATINSYGFHLFDANDGSRIYNLKNIQDIQMPQTSYNQILSAIDPGVRINDHCVIVPTVNMDTDEFELVLFPALNGHSCFKLKQPKVLYCGYFKLGVTPTKIINYVNNAIRIFDFM